MSYPQPLEGHALFKSIFNRGGKSGRETSRLSFVYSYFTCKQSKKKRADERTRTADLLITSELLYLLSYVGLASSFWDVPVFRGESISHEVVAFTGCPGLG